MRPLVTLQINDSLTLMQNESGSGSGNVVSIGTHQMRSLRIQPELQVKPQEPSVLKSIMSAFSIEGGGSGIHLAMRCSVSRAFTLAGLAGGRLRDARGAGLVVTVIACEVLR